jgi:hypothetical protein
VIIENHRERYLILAFSTRPVTTTRSLVHKIIFSVIIQAQ